MLQIVFVSWILSQISTLQILSLPHPSMYWTTYLIGYDLAHTEYFQLFLSFCSNNIRNAGTVSKLQFNWGFALLPDNVGCSEGQSNVPGYAINNNNKIDPNNWIRNFTFKTFWVTLNYLNLAFSYKVFSYYNYANIQIYACLLDQMDWNS